ncbi:predicted protein [Naegleria gruberi]|uniref:Predicted protein n=1 Tax=Naegleria gruberi TaxID=5762 RepID=D2UZN8_NAEGR|nr:uncharacterized protein NAEGRDRAFT_62007 [Naegleria gruberi]EFC50193.1 predicted protein [Naegleria gruberi]|eukprot:XP_002682937.1 predicted protein [Naegleria gruberi strain NEG-M]
MSERLPLSPFEFESDISDNEVNPYDQLSIFDTVSHMDEDEGHQQQDHLLNHSLVQMWDMTEESDDFPNEGSMLISHSSTLTAHHMSYDHDTILGEGSNMLMVPIKTTSATTIENGSMHEIQHTIFSEEEYSQELNGTTNCSTLNDLKSVSSSQRKLFRPATITSSSSTTQDESELNIKNNIYQTICPHLFSTEEVLVEGDAGDQLLQSSPVSESLLATPLYQASIIKEENEISMMNTTSNPIVYDEETDEPSEDGNDSFYDHCSTTSDDSSDFDYMEVKKRKTSTKTSKKKVAETKPQKKKKMESPSKSAHNTERESKRKSSKKIGSKKDKSLSSNGTPVAEGDIRYVYSGGFLNVRLKMPAQCKGLGLGIVPACKPAFYYEGKNMVNDTSDSAKFTVVVEAVNCPDDFDVSKIDLVVLSCSSKDRGDNLKEIERITDVDGSLDSTTSVHCMLSNDPSGNELLKINDSDISDDSNKISYNCSITTSNNHSDWHVKHNYYRILVTANNGSVIGGLSVPFKVAKNASATSSALKTNVEGKKNSNLKVIVRVSGCKGAHHLTQTATKTFFDFEGIKYQVSLTRVEINE